ncbi:uncharacterized protein LAESUDRAFT_722309 [Laetiporus sulphureus 93-53]|uniref:Uncharacterized protein n=1 Tax=Laetiporus sulphureus 93-53 TaxID=1314785 RepID=A0A165GC52_9APHY|nr:uncharacterized protein LAESUDRAFT_722309 [Laetiporus sulphureus 93-53]KZT10141.1 hypothetical protein LAESUDRAFT_722309 [Laetiporus sulphureus 93-53]
MAVVKSTQGKRTSHSLALPRSLRVLGFDREKVKAHPTVVEWMRTLQTVPEQ